MHTLCCNREEFLQLHSEGVIYFDSAATALKPRRVIDAMTQFYTHEYGTVHRAIYDFAENATVKYNQVRIEVQKFLNAAFVDEIIFTKGTTEAINLVASSFGSFLKPGDEILISELEHHSNIVPWQLLSERTGAVLKVIPINENGELLLTSISSRTKIVSIAYISNALGTLNPVREIIQKAHAKGAKVLIDGAQAAAHLPIDVQELDADFFAFSGHKAFGPTGVGVLYGKRELLQIMPPYQGGGDMVERVTFAQTTYQKPPLKFEAGTPMIAEVIGLGAALSYIESLGRPNIWAHGQELLAHATEKLSPHVRILGTAKQKGPILTFVIPGLHPLDIGTLLNLHGIAVRTGHLCAQPALDYFGVTAAVRLSFAPYNTLEEIDVFVSALQEVIIQLS